jgi:hypothetical protein
VSPETARFVLLAIALCGALAWLFALWGFERVRSLGPGESEQTDAGGGARLVAARTKLVSGQPADLAEGLLRTLAGGGGWGAAPVVVKREGPLVLVATAIAPPRLITAPAFESCRIELRPAPGGSTEATFRADYTAFRRRLLVIAGIVLAAGLAVMVALFAFLWLKVLPSDRPAVRGQVIQAIQMIHVLWPPWLVYALYGRARQATDIFLDAAVANASALAEAFAAGRRKASGGNAR